MRYCPQCGTASSSSGDYVESESLACPGCGDRHCTSLLQSRKVGEHRLHECVACHGIWLTSQTVDAITSDANARALFAPNDLSAAKQAVTAKSITAFRYRRCPHCATFMTRVNIAKISGVIVDRCAEHGTYFDLDELHSLVRFLEAGGLDRARAREREDLAMERRRLQMLMDLDQRRSMMDYAPTDEVPETSVAGLLTALLRRAAR